MKASTKDNNSPATGVVTGNLYRIFDCFSAGCNEQGLDRARHRRKGIETLCPGNIALIRGSSKKGVSEAIQLTTNRCDDPGMRVTNGESTHSTYEVDVPSPLNIPKLSIGRSFSKDWECAGYTIWNRRYAPALKFEVADVHILFLRLWTCCANRL